MSICMSFVMSTMTPSGDATEHHKHLPRAMRKTLRLAPAKAQSNTHDGVDSYMRTEFRTDAYHNTNTIDPDACADEFDDIDNEFDGLTITHAMSETELFEFCTGYNIL